MFSYLFRSKIQIDLCFSLKFVIYVVCTQYTNNCLHPLMVVFYTVLAIDVKNHMCCLVFNFDVYVRV